MSDEETGTTGTNTATTNTSILVLDWAIEEVREKVKEYYTKSGLVKLLPIHNLHHLPVEVNIYKADRLLEGNYILHDFKPVIFRVLKDTNTLPAVIAYDQDNQKLISTLYEIKHAGRKIINDLDSDSLLKKLLKD